MSKLPMDFLPAPLQVRLHAVLSRVVNRFGGAIEFWTVVCISQSDLGDPQQFVTEQWTELYGDVQELRSVIAEAEMPSPVVQEQVMKLMKSCTDLREVFDLFLRCGEIPLPDLEGAVFRLSALWQDVRTRVSFIAALIPLPEPLPRLTSEQEVFYQSILDSLFDQLAVVRGMQYRPQTDSDSGFPSQG